MYSDVKCEHPVKECFAMLRGAILSGLVLRVFFECKFVFYFALYCSSYNVEWLKSVLFCFLLFNMKVINVV